MTIAIAELEKKIYDAWDKVNAPDVFKRKKIYFSDDTKGLEGIYVYIQEGMFYMALSQRGNVEQLKTTDREFEIIFWILRDLALTQSIKMAEDADVAQKDFRKYILEKQVEILNKIDIRYGIMKKTEIEDALKRTPL